MMLRRSLTGAVLGVALTAAAWTALPVAGAEAATHRPATPAGQGQGHGHGQGGQGVARASAVRWLASQHAFQQLVDMVVAQVRASYPTAQLMEIDGSSPGGPTTSIFDVTRWRFDFNADTEQTHTVVQATVSLPDTTAVLTTVDDVFVGSLQLTNPVAMSPLRSWILLRAAGYTAPFQFVTYRQPIASGFVPHPLFIYDQGSGFVGVDSVTGDVAPIG
jgi:hypothetical protein